MTTTTYRLDGVPGLLPDVVIDLTCEQIDVTGARWSWTGERSATGVPLMAEVDNASDIPMPLNVLFAERGPLIPAARPTTNALARTVLHAPYEGDDLVRPPLPVQPVLQSPALSAVTASAAPAEEPKPADETPAPAVPSPSALARLLGRMRGAR